MSIKHAVCLKSRQAKLLMSAGAVAVISSFSGLSAYLTDTTEPLNRDLQIKFGDNFKIVLNDSSADQYEQTNVIVPGSTVPFSPKLTNTGNYPVYVFLEVTIPDQDLSLVSINRGWTEIVTEWDRHVYAYGSANAMQKLQAADKDSNQEYVYDEAPALCAGIQLDQNTDLREQPMTVTAVGYAIQAGLTDNNPETLWAAVEEQLSKNAAGSQNEENIS